jgi:hypothetical protein
MSQQTDICENLIQSMLLGNKDAEKLCRDFLKQLAASDAIPMLDVATILRCAIDCQNNWQNNN